VTKTTIGGIIVMIMLTILLVKFNLVR